MNNHAFTCEVLVSRSEVNAFREAFDLPWDTDMRAMFNALLGHAANDALDAEGYDRAQIHSLALSLDASVTLNADLDAELGGDPYFRGRADYDNDIHENPYTRTSEYGAWEEWQAGYATAQERAHGLPLRGG